MPIRSSDYLREYGKRITQAEAQGILDRKEGIVRGGGYTFLPTKIGQLYLAYGTFPGNMRGGAAANLDNLVVNQWYLVSLIDLACMCGFVPSTHFNIPLEVLAAGQHQNAMELESVIYPTLMENVLPEAVRKDPTQCAAWWRLHLNRQVQSEKGDG